jgi:hypothetical protein
MKKITLLLFALFATWQISAQVLNQNANWPNAAWVVTGSYETASAAFESDPRTTANFAFDDDDALNGHEDNIAAESPVIDLSPAFTAGQTWLTVTVQYGYRYFANDQLRFEYWNANTSAWVAWGANIPGNSTTATDNFCTTITKTTYTTSTLNIAGFTPTQLSGFKYRISYDDDPAGADWNYGFCFDSPTIVSSMPPLCPSPTVLAAVPTSTSATLSWTENGIATLYNIEYGLNGFSQGAGTLLSGVSNSYNLTPLTPGTAFSYYVQAACGGSAGNSTWAGPFNFTTLFTPPINDDCAGAISLTVNPNLACGSVTAGTVLGATASVVDATACGGTEDDDVWFSFVATSASHRISILNATGSVTDMYHSLWTGADCNSLTLVAGSCSDPNDSTRTGLTIGQTYYLRVYTFTATTGQTTTFNVCVGTPPPPPANDECSGAISLTVNPDFSCGTVTPGTVLSATASAVDATACGGTEDDDVWFSFVATSTSHRISILNATGSVTDMYHSLWTGADCNSLTLVAGSCSDPNDSTRSGLTIGQTYYLRVYTFTATAGQTTTFNVCIGTPPPPPANDECSGAISLTVNTGLLCGSVTPGTIASATASAVDATACGGTEDDDVWFSFVATSTAHRISILNVTGSVTDMYHSLWTGADCNSLTLVAGSCSDPNDSTRSGLTIGQIYYLRVYTVTATAGQTTTFNVCIGTPPPSPPANDECTGAIALTPGGVFADNDIDGINILATLSANTPIPTCGNFNFATSAKDVWYSVIVPASGSLTIETGVHSSLAGIDTVFSVYSGDCNTLTQVGCDDDGAPETTFGLSRLVLTGQTPGATLLIRLFGYNGLDGLYSISAYDASLGNNSFDNSSFSYYPNPVKNTLNLSYSQEISNVEVYNLLGQKVRVISNNANEVQVDMSNLPRAAYIVKVTSNNQVKTIKVIKE